MLTETTKALIPPRGVLGMDGSARRRTLFYLLYAVVLTVALLYLRFPAEKFRVYWENRVEALFPGSDCTIEGIAFRPPLSVVFNNLQVVRQIDGRPSTFRVDRLAAAPDFSHLLKEFQVNGQMYQGEFSLNLAVDGETRSFALTEIEIVGVRLDAWAEDFNLLERKVAGKASLTGSYRAGFAAPLAGTGKGELQAEDGSVDLLQPILSLRSLSFDRLRAELSHDQELLRLVKGELTGQEITAEFTGEMRVASPLPASLVIMSGSLTPRENYLATHPGEKRLVEQLLRRYKTSALPFKVGGTLRSPTFRFSL